MFQLLVHIRKRKVCSVLVLEEILARLGSLREVMICISIILSLCVCVSFVFFFFLGPHPRPVEVPRLGV